MRIAHRVNFLDAIQSAQVFSVADGIEFDIRDSGGKIIVYHDAFGTIAYAQDFVEFLQFCPPDKFYIVNVKSEGIEHRAIQLLEAHGITRFFLLDCSIPMMVRLGYAGERRLAVRFSEFEGIETVKLMAPFVSWIWIDVFTCLPINELLAEYMKSALHLNICLVSPELQGQPDKISEYVDALTKQNIKLDAVCTKMPHIINGSWPSSLFPDPMK